MWIIYLVTGTTLLAWIAVAALVLVAIIGVVMVRQWAKDGRAAMAAATAGAAPSSGASGLDLAEQHIPRPPVVLHGIFAVTTVVLVLLTALGMGAWEADVDRDAQRHEAVQQRRAGLLAQIAEQRSAGRLTSAASLSADPAVLMHVGVARTVIATDATSNTACFQERLGDAGIRTGPARQDGAGCGADLGAVKVGTNAVHQIGDHLFSQTGVRACRADLRAIETGLDAFGKLCLIMPSQALRVGLQHLGYTRHRDLLSLVDLLS